MSLDDPKGSAIATVPDMGRLPLDSWLIKSVAHGSGPSWPCRTRVSGPLASPSMKMRRVVHCLSGTLYVLLPTRAWKAVPVSALAGSVVAVVDERPGELGICGRVVAQPVRSDAKKARNRSIPLAVRAAHAARTVRIDGKISIYSDYKNQKIPAIFIL